MFPKLEKSIRAPEFSPQLHEAGKKHRLSLCLGSAANDVALPVLLIRGAREGPTLVVTAGVHGDEFEGVRATLEVCSDLDPATMSGSLIAVPVANPLAFSTGSRNTPADNGNLARAFPGHEKGSPTQVIAFHLGRSIIAHADFYLDLHSAGIKLLMPTMVGYDGNDSRSYEAALAFRAPVAWEHTAIGPGRTISFAASRSIPWLYTEARGAGRIDTEDLHIFKNGIVNVMRHLKILDGEVLTNPSDVQMLTGDGDIDMAIKATQSGFFVSTVELLERVKQGQELGRTFNLHGELIESFHAAKDGIVGMIHVFPVVEQGDSLFLLASSGKC